MQRRRTAFSCSALVAIGASGPAAAVDTLPLVSLVGTSSRVETSGSIGFEDCWYGAELTNCSGPPPPAPPVSVAADHDHSAETADTNPLSITDSYTQDGHLIEASASAETAFAVNRASVSATGSYVFDTSRRVPACGGACEENVIDVFEGYEAAAAVSVWQDTWTFHGPADFVATVVIRIEGTTDLQKPNLGYIFDGYYNDKSGATERTQQITTAALLVTGAHWFANDYNAGLPPGYYVYSLTNGWVDHDTTTYPGPSFSRELRTLMYVTHDYPIHVGSLLITDAGGALDADDALDVSHTVTLERIEVPAGVTMTAASGDASIYHVPEPAAEALELAAAGALLALRRRCAGGSSARSRRAAAGPARPAAPPR